jgi:WhiB family transcriptional regulator, redox-sensing transcriptional regulator
MTDQMERSLDWDLYLLPTRPEWHERAACMGAGSALFFPAEGASAGELTRAVIDDYCAQCPVIAECNAAGTHERYGVWGGTTRPERRRLRRGRQEAA